MRFCKEIAALTFLVRKAMGIELDAFVEAEVVQPLKNCVRTHNGKHV